MTDVYATPEANVETKDEIIFSFSSLGFWRKLFLVINWLATIPIVSLFLLGGFAGGSETEVSTVVVLVISILFIGYCYWLHVAVSRRNLTQLTILSIVQIVPFLNPIGALILFAIRSTSKKELTPTSANQEA